MTEQVFQSIATKSLAISQEIRNIAVSKGKVGATAGWATAVDDGTFRLPAGSTASTFHLGIDVNQGYIIKSYKVLGQIESGGNTVTLDAALHYTTVAAADLVDTAVTNGAITQISKTADYAINDSATGINHTVLAGANYFILFTGTTAASTDIAVQSVEITFERLR